MARSTCLAATPLSSDTDGDGVSDAADADPLDAAIGSIATTIADGDIAPLGNRDGQLTLADAAVALRILEEPGLASPADIAHGEVAPATNNSIDPPDALLILRAATDPDVDGDGLANDVELAVGSSPFRVDSDFDGLTDDVEVNPPPGTPATNPSSRDSDGDGLLDIQELALGSDPNNADSDADGILDSADAQLLEGWRFYHVDHLQSSTVVTSIDGSLLSRVLYRPFGQAIELTGTTPDFGFTGQRFEPDLGIYDYGARFYDPVLARFLSPDPLVPSLANPQDLNRYSYVLNDPLAKVDPTGEYSTGVQGFYGRFFNYSDEAEHARGMAEGAGEAAVDAVTGVLTLVFNPVDKSVEIVDAAGRIVTDPEVRREVVAAFGAEIQRAVEGDARAQGRIAFELGTIALSALKIGKLSKIEKMSKTSKRPDSPSEKTAEKTRRQIAEERARDEKARAVRAGSDIVRETAREQAARSTDDLIEAYLSGPEEIAYRKNPAGGSRFLGQAIHRATAQALNSAYPGRFRYHTRGHDFTDTLTGEAIELTTPLQVPHHMRRAAGNPANAAQIVTY